MKLDTQIEAEIFRNVWSDSVILVRDGAFTLADRATLRALLLQRFGPSAVVDSLDRTIEQACGRPGRWVLVCDGDRAPTLLARVLSCAEEACFRQLAEGRHAGDA
jgi:hypothetical protein